MSDPGARASKTCIDVAVRQSRESQSRELRLVKKRRCLERLPGLHVLKTAQIEAEKQQKTGFSGTTVVIAGTLKVPPHGA